MSSGPVGLNALEYGYGKTTYVIPDGLTHFLGTRGAWLVTKIQFYTGANLGAVGVEGTPFTDVQPNACLVLEPNGAHRGEIIVSGEAATLIVEWWWQGNATRTPPTVYIL